ncbi:MAG TPA: DUF4097 family beta strand repeat-containing protein [Mycobacteriales bacterium]|nr:DUF4097 family beta strand repeat-containing protein [Mycobacteriales bacterium]
MTPQRFFSVGIGAAASLALAGFFGTQALEWGSGSTSHTDHHTYRQDIRQIDVSSTNGRIVLEPATGSAVTVERTINESLRSAPTSTQVRGGTLQLSGRCGSFLFGSCSVTYVVQVPKDVAVTAWVANGRISASGLRGKAELSTSSGSIDAADIHGSLQAETSSGSIHATAIEGAEITLRTGSGSIHGDRLDAPRVTAETGSGGIDLGTTSAPNLLKANTGSGHATVQVPVGPAYDVDTDGAGNAEVGVRQDSTSSHHVLVDTGSGKIEVKYGK